MATITLDNIKLKDLAEALQKQGIDAEQKLKVWAEFETLKQTTPKGKPVRKRSEADFIGVWRDRDDMTDVDAFVRDLRKPRY